MTREVAGNGRAAQRRTVESIREFNRFYTRTIGVLERGFLGSPFSLTEVRVLLELYYRKETTAAAIRRALGIDAGYLSRMLRGFAARGLLAPAGAGADARERPLRLSAVGRKTFEELERRQRDALRGMLEPIPSAGRTKLVDSMGAIQRILSPSDAVDQSFTLRQHRPGDIGWIIHRQGLLYYQEYGWDERFEALVAEILAQFIQNFDPKHERAWIAERNGEIVGAIFCVRKSATVAQLRLLYVEASARGAGIGKRLVEECIAFARAARYRKMVLWTNSVLHSARRIYEAKGFRLSKEERHHSFGKNLVGQFWELNLLRA